MNNPTPMDPSLLLNARQVASLLSIGRRTLWRHVAAGIVPPPVAIGRRKLWRRKEISDWIDVGCPPTGTLLSI